jgi:glucose-6-phosphate isomerase
MDIKILYQDSLFLNENEIYEQGKALSPYISSLQSIVEKGGYDTPECSLNLVSDGEQFRKADAMAKSLGGERLKYVIVVGIGGSNLGAAAVYEAMYGKTDLFLSRTPKLIFADTNNPREMEHIKNVLEKNVGDSREVVVNVITKSGTTTETIANAGFLFEVLKQKFGEKIAAERMVITSDDKSELGQIAFEKGMHVLPIPPNVGGRYSVFSAVGIFPLQLAGVNMSELIEGARVMRSHCLKLPGTEDAAINPAIFGAVSSYLYSRKKLNVYNSFFFNSELESLGKWWRQLFAESLGKRYSLDGSSVYAGMTPIVSIGSTDLHSMVQLYFGGPKDKLTNFIYTTADAGRASVPREHPFMKFAPDISGKDFTEIMGAILGGTKEAYKEHALPFTETVLPNIDEYSIGQFLQLKMMETMFLAKLWNINAFDQPEVESYKKITQELLKKK